VGSNPQQKAVRKVNIKDVANEPPTKILNPTCGRKTKILVKTPRNYPPSLCLRRPNNRQNSPVNNPEQCGHFYPKSWVWWQLQWLFISC